MDSGFWTSAGRSPACRLVLTVAHHATARPHARWQMRRQRSTLLGLLRRAYCYQSALQIAAGSSGFASEPQYYAVSCTGVQLGALLLQDGNLYAHHLTAAVRLV